jgi:signal peptidase II
VTGVASTMRRGNALPWLWLSLALIVVDQITKYLAETHLGYQSPVPVLPFLNWTLVYNPGAAFSFLSNAGGWQRWLFTALAVGVSALLVRWLAQTPRDQRWVAVPYALIVAGAIGNVIDRVRYGHVIDFVDVYWRDWHFPAFNVADSAISLGAAGLIAGLFFARNDSAFRSGSSA